MDEIDKITAKLDEDFLDFLDETYEIFGMDETNSKNPGGLFLDIVRLVVVLTFVGFIAFALSRDCASKFEATSSEPSIIPVTEEKKPVMAEAEEDSCSCEKIHAGTRSNSSRRLLLPRLKIGGH